jgi:HSP20 family protein
MAEIVTKLPIKQEKSSAAPSIPQAWQPFESLRQEIDRLFDDFGRGFLQPFRWSLFSTEPLFGRELTWGTTPAVDVVESEKAYEITADSLPKMQSSAL